MLLAPLRPGNRLRHAWEAGSRPRAGQWMGLASLGHRMGDMPGLRLLAHMCNGPRARPPFHCEPSGPAPAAVVAPIATVVACLRTVELRAREGYSTM